MVQSMYLPEQENMRKLGVSGEQVQYSQCHLDSPRVPDSPCVRVDGGVGLRRARQD